MKLESPINKLPLVGPVYIRRLTKLNISTIENLLHHVPHRYLDYTLISKIDKVQIGETVTIKGVVASIKNQYTKGSKKIQFAQVSDNSGVLDVIWFNQPFLIRTIKKGSKISLAGKLDWFGRKRVLVSPEYELIKDGVKTLHTGRLVPVYPTTAGVSTKWLRSRIAASIPLVTDTIQEYLPSFILKKHNLVDLATAISWVHFPDNLIDADKGRRRLSFNELLLLQLKTAYRKLDWRGNSVVHKLNIDKNELKGFFDYLPFELTTTQKRSVDEILTDLASVTPMNRLLEGDVGSGKTVVAATAAFISFANGYQSVFMAPTQILAKQHYNTLREIFDPFNVRVTLVTSAGVKGGPGKTDIFVGTHALIHKRVDFDNVVLVVIDEQQRFGVEQRAHLIKKSGKKRKAPHVLTMTATPIPRTVALTAYGDLDLSTIDELPKGRQKITTWLVPPSKREGAYNWIAKQIKDHRIQVFVICPLIEESEKETMKLVKAATAEYKKLKKIFSTYKLGLLHGKLKAKEKDEIMDKFEDGKIDILVSTPVVEVGIDVPNAAIMLIEASDRFGLSQLHQLRGRVGRGEKKSYCLLFTARRGRKIMSRLSALTRGMSGFELAELDLKLRGPGEVFGKLQHGFLELRIANWQDTELIKKAKKVAEDAIANPKKYSKLLAKIKSSKIVPN